MIPKYHVVLSNKLINLTLSKKCVIFSIIIEKGRNTMKRNIAILFLIFLICTLCACSNSLFSIKNLEYEEKEYDYSNSSIIVGGGDFIVSTYNELSFEIVGKGEAEAVYTVFVQIGIYSNGDYIDTVSWTGNLNGNECKNVSINCDSYQGKITVKLLKITWI